MPNGWKPKTADEWFRAVESQLSQLAHHRHGPVTATFGDSMIDGTMEAEPPPEGAIDESTVPVLPDIDDIAFDFGGPDVFTPTPEDPITPDPVVPVPDPTPDTTPPLQPSKPILFSRMGLVVVRFDGLAEDLQRMTPDTAYVEVHRSEEGPDFTPTQNTYWTEIPVHGGSAIAADQEYNSRWYYRFVAVDTADLRSPPSTGADSLTIPLQDTDLLGRVVGLANLKDDVFEEFGTMAPPTTPTGSEVMYNVQDSNALGDGITNDTAAVQSAVTLAYGADLYWPKGTYRVTGNIAGFWDVNHHGPGQISLPGGTIFKVTPTINDTIDIYTHGTTGSFSNDGLSSSSPTTLARVADILRIGPVAARKRAQWRVNLKGTYTGGYTYAFLPPMFKPIVFQGEPLVAGAPVTKINWNNDATRQFGLRIDPAHTRIEINNIEFNDFAVGFNGYGVLMKNGGQLYVTDCVANNCDQGFAAINNVDFSMLRCKANGSLANGFFATYSSSGAFIDCEADGCGDYGFYVSRNAVTHIDYCTVTDNVVAGVKIDMAARAHILGSTIWRNPVGVDTQGAAEWINNTDTPNDFGYGTANANTIAPWYSHGASRENRSYAQTAFNEHLIGSSWDIWTVTGTTSDTVAILGSVYGRLMPLHMVGVNKKLRFRVMGSQTGNGTKRLSIRTTSDTGSNNTMLAEITIPAGQTGAFDWEVNVTSRGKDGSCRVQSRLLINGQNAVVTNHGVVTFDPSLQRLFRWYVQNSDAAATTQIIGMEFFAAG